MPSLFAGAVDQIVAKDPDLFVLSGDLLDYPLDGMDHPFLQAQAVKDLYLIEQILEQITCPSVLVYGNHDHPELFRQHFEPLATDQGVNGWRVLSFLDDEGPGNVPQRTGESQRRFAAALSADKSQPQIHVQHYLVWPERNDSYPHTYGVGHAMRKDIVASGYVRLVLSGHYHAGVAPALKGGVWFSTVPAFCEAPHPYWLYELSGDDLTWTQYEVDVPHSHV